MLPPSCNAGSPVGRWRGHFLVPWELVGHRTRRTAPVAGKYRVDRRAGKGHNGVEVRARDAVTSRGDEHVESECERGGALTARHRHLTAGVGSDRVGRGVDAAGQHRCVGGVDVGRRVDAERGCGRGKSTACGPDRRSSARSWTPLRVTEGRSVRK